jgi:hypothetical protein
MGKGEMGTAREGKPPSLPRELRTPLVSVLFLAKARIMKRSEFISSPLMKNISKYVKGKLSTCHFTFKVHIG